MLEKYKNSGLEIENRYSQSKKELYNELNLIGKKVKKNRPKLKKLLQSISGDANDRNQYSEKKKSLSLREINLFHKKRAGNLKRHYKSA